MYYSLILTYLLTSFLYFCVFNTISKIVEKMHQNATSKNRTAIKKIKESTSLRKRKIAALTWPFYEVYLMIGKNE